MFRALFVAPLAAALAASPLASQTPGSTTGVVGAASTAPAQAPTPPRPPQMDGRLRTEIALLSRLMGDVNIPSADEFRVGNHEVAADADVSGPVAVARGNLDVRGTIVGDAVVLHGDVIVHPGGEITGSAVAVDGRIRTLGGVIRGDMRSIGGIAGGILARAAGRTADAEPLTPWRGMKMALGWFAVLFVIGVGVLLFAERNLNGVVEALRQDFGRSFWMGVLAQIAALPALMLVVLALAISLIGILLIPFAVVAYVIAMAGLLTLGFLAVARFTGGAFAGTAEDAHVRGVDLRALFIGLLIYMGVWFVAAGFMFSPIVGAALRAIALAASWVALTLGLGATLITRAGTRRGDERVRRAPTREDLSWQTPTPVTGVVAARRPVSAVKE